MRRFSDGNFGQYPALMNSRPKSLVGNFAPRVLRPFLNAFRLPKCCDKSPRFRVWIKLVESVQRLSSNCFGMFKIVGLAGDLHTEAALTILAVWSRVRIFWRALMPACAVRLSECLAVIDVLPSRGWLKMVWIYAGPILAKMVQLHAVWNRSSHELVRDSVSGCASPVEADVSVACWSASSREKPASSWLNFDPPIKAFFNRGVVIHFIFKCERRQVSSKVPRVPGGYWFETSPGIEN